MKVSAKNAQFAAATENDPHLAVSEELRFAIGDCSLGSVLVAQSERGICAILLGDEPETLARDLQDRFPKVQLIGGDQDFEQWGCGGRRFKSSRPIK